MPEHKSTYWGSIPQGTSIRAVVLLPRMGPGGIRQILPSPYIESESIRAGAVN